MGNDRRLRSGLTTGTCSAAAAMAATMLLLSGEGPERVELTLPIGKRVGLAISESHRNGGSAFACVIKDAGDDPDITNGLSVWAEVCRSEISGIAVDGGKGVGRVTLPGLDQPVGAAAINSVPRRMIREAAEKAARLYGYTGGLRVIIHLPEGEALAKKTFNPRLGIVDGLSVLGTSGVVEPMSEQAMVDSVCLEVRMRAASGKKLLLITPGNYGRDFLMRNAKLPETAVIRCSNHFGAVLDCAAEYGFKGVLIVSHLGKLIKLAGNMFDTHSKHGDCRMDILTAHAATQGIAPRTARALLDCATVDAGLDLLEPLGLLEGTLRSILSAVQKNAWHRAGLPVEALTFTNLRGRLLRTEGFDVLLERLLKEES